MKRIPVTDLIWDIVQRTDKIGAMTIITFVSRRYLVLTDIPGHHQGAEAFDPDR